jgi:hypothetical protein
MCSNGGQCLLSYFKYVGSERIRIKFGVRGLVVRIVGLI